MHKRFCLIEMWAGSRSNQIFGKLFAHRSSMALVTPERSKLMRNIQFRGCLLALVLLAIPASTWAKESEHSDRGSEPTQNKKSDSRANLSDKLKEFLFKAAVKESAKTVVREFTSITLLGKAAGIGVDVFWPTRLGVEPPLPEPYRSAGLVPESQPANSAFVAKPAAESKSMAKSSSSPTSQHVPPDRGDNGDLHQRVGGDKSKTGNDGGRASNPREDAGLEPGPSHEGRP